MVAQNILRTCEIKTDGIQFQFDKTVEVNKCLKNIKLLSTFAQNNLSYQMIYVLSKSELSAYFLNCSSKENQDTHI